MADEQGQTEEQAANANLEQLRKKAERADELEKQLALRDKQDAFRAAKIDFEAGPGKLVWDTFKAEGPITADSVTAYAAQYGVAPTPATPAPTDSGGTPPPNMTEAERAHFALVNQPGSTESDPASQLPVGERSFKAFTDAQRAGNTRDAAQLAGLGAIFQAAADGDQSVLYDQARWREQHGGR